MALPFSKCPCVFRFTPESGARQWTIGQKTILTENDLIIYHENAEVQYSTQELILRAKPGSVLFLPRGCSVVAETLLGESVIVIGFQQCESQVRSLNLSLVSSSAPSRLKNRFLHFVSEYAKPLSVVSECSMLTDFYGILHELSRNTADGNRQTLQEEKIRPSVAYLEHHFLDKKLNMGQIAALSGISETYFRTLFFRQFGCTPLQFVIRKKLEYARTLLVETDLPIPEIESTCGFRDHAYFIEQFQSAYGTAPDALRPQSDSMKNKA